MKHIPVMLDEAMEGLKIREDGVYVDGTYGAGGHSSEILNRLTIGVLYGFDRDLSVLVAAKSDRRLRLRHNNFSDMADVLRADGVRSEERRVGKSGAPAGRGRIKYGACDEELDDSQSCGD